MTVNSTKCRSRIYTSVEVEEKLEEVMSDLKNTRFIIIGSAFLAIIMG